MLLAHRCKIGLRVEQQIRIQISFHVKPFHIVRIIVNIGDAFFVEVLPQHFYTTYLLHRCVSI